MLILKNGILLFLGAVICTLSGLSSASDFDVLEKRLNIESLAKTMIVRSFLGGTGTECSIQLDLSENDIRIAIQKQKGIAGTHYSKHFPGDWLKYDVRYEFDVDDNVVEGVFIFSTAFYKDPNGPYGDGFHMLGEYSNQYGTGGLLKIDASLNKKCGKYDRNQKSGFDKAQDGLQIKSSTLEDMPLLSNTNFNKYVQGVQMQLSYVEGMEFSGSRDGVFGPTTASAMKEFVSLPFNVKADEKTRIITASEEGVSAFDDSLYDLIYDIKRRPK